MRVPFILWIPLLLLSVGCSSGSGTSSLSSEPTNEVAAVATSSVKSELPSEDIPVRDFLKEAGEEAKSAKHFSQNSVSKDDWDLAISRWESAIALLRMVEEKDANYELAQQRLQEYETALNATLNRVADPGNTFETAMQFARQAAEKVESAESLDDWQRIDQAWLEAINLLKLVPAESSNHSVAQQKIVEYSKNLTYAKQQQTKIAAQQSPSEPSGISSASSVSIGLTSSGSGASSSTRSVSSSLGSSSSSSGSGNCDYPWQTDSLGRSCGDRAASVRPGGRLGGTGSSTSSRSSGSSCHYVSGYTRRNGTRVSGYTRCR